MVHVYGANGTYQGWRPYSRIFSSDDLYTVFNNGVRDLQTEKSFKVIEDEFLKVRNAVDGEQPLPAATKTILALCVAAMRNRSPASRDQWQSFKNRIVEVGDQMAAGFENASPAERQRMARPSILRASANANSMTLEEARSAAAEPFGTWVLRHVAVESRMLEQMSFVIMKAPEGIGFITSDNPVVWHDAVSQGAYRRRLGLGYPFIEVSMPISPRYCVIFHHLGKDGTCDVSQTTVDKINSRTLGQCDACFIATSSKLIVDWIEHENEGDLSAL